MCNRYIKFLYNFITKKSIFVVVVSSLSRYGNGYSQVCWTGNGYSQVCVYQCRCSTLKLLFSFQTLKWSKPWYPRKSGEKLFSWSLQRISKTIVWSFALFRKCDTLQSVGV